MFGKKTKQNEVTAAKGGSSVSSFVSPVFLVAVLMIVLVGLVDRWLMLQNEHGRLLKGLATTAANVVQLFEVRLKGEQTVLELLAQDAELIEILATQGDAAQVQSRLKQVLPAADTLLVVPANMDTDILLKTLFNSYLALNLHERAIKTGAVPVVEALKSGNNSAFVIAVPVKQQENVLGTLFAYYKMDLLGSTLQHLQLGNGVIGLEQVVDSAHFVLAGSPGFTHEVSGVSLPVKNTLWQIKYGFAGTAGLNELLPLLALVVIAVLLLFLVFNRQKKELAQAIEADMGAAVSLMDATLKRVGTPGVQPSIAESASALALLSKYAKATFSSPRGAESDNNKVDLPTPQTANNNLAEELSDEIFLANDIRGVNGQTLTPFVGQQLGMAVGTLALNSGETSVLVGHDARLSSDELAAALIAGILASGCDVADLGLVPVPLLYFASHVLSSRSCVMVTGGHNPTEYNGFKIIIDGKPLVGDELLGLKGMLESGKLRSGTGNLQTQDVSGGYLRQVTGDIQLLESRKVVVDGGNGAGAPLLVRLLREVGCEVVELFCDPDGRFPNHFPDPANAENLSALALEVQAQGADFGVALDGDGDRLALVDEKGEQVATDLLLMVLAADIIRRNPGADVIYDVKSSSYLPGYILSNGGRPVMCKTGHALMKIRMQETGALLGGEYSGHLYIKDRWFGFDDAVYATVRLLELFSMEPQPVSAFFAALPKGASTGALELEVSREQAEALLQSLAQQLDAGEVDVIDLDGLRFEYSDGWALIRLSNTMPHLVFRFEGKDQLALENAQARLRSQIQRIMPELILPF